MPTWLACRDHWLSAKGRRSGRPHTVRAYAADWSDFFSTFATWQDTPTGPQGLPPWQVSRTHAAVWAEALAERGLAPATIARKLSALSSFYAYAADYVIQDPARGAVALWDHPNPFRLADLPRIQQDPVYPTSAEVIRLLAVIDTTTPTGLRNLAILAGMFATTRRVSEWLPLRWGDIQERADGGHYFRYRYKGGQINKQDLPPDLYVLIVHYLQAAGRWPLAADAYVFVALADAARLLDRVAPAYDPAEQPLSESYAWSLLQRYGKEAHVDPAKCHPHGLRHAGARYLRTLGADIYELQAVLGHASLAVTERYTRDVLDEPADKFGGHLAAVLPVAYRRRAADALLR